MPNYKLYTGDCLDIMKDMEPNSVDSIVTDPPYHLKSIVKRFGKPNSAPAQYGTDGVYSRHSTGFMGKVWDGGEIAQNPATWDACLRIAKPGAYLLAFGGTRTFHRMMCAIEDAGWEIRDTVMWVYGQGFPKSHNLHDEWEGWGTALKPAWEPIVVARKPLEGTVAQNVLEYGTGAINIDATRIPSGTEHMRGNVGAKVTDSDWKNNSGFGKPFIATDSPLGRWPANLIHDESEEVLKLFPQTAPSHIGKPRGTAKKGLFANSDFNKVGTEHEDSGSAARFFYCAKASKQDRDEGCGELEEINAEKMTGRQPGTAGLLRVRSDGTIGENPYAGKSGEAHNHHPTVKPTNLMRYLCRLVTQPNGIVFDPFTGSGSTGKASMLEGFNFIGCDNEPEYIKIADARIKYTLEHLSLTT